MSNPFSFDASVDQSRAQSTSSQQLFGPQAELFSQIFGQAGNLAGQGLQPGGPLQQQGQGFLDTIQQFSQQGNPFLQGQIDVLGQNIQQNLSQNILPGIGSQAAIFGQRGGGRQGVAEGLAAQGAQQQFAQGTQNLLFQGGQQQLGAAQAGIRGAQDVFNLGLAPTMAQFLPLQLAAGLASPIPLTQQQSTSQRDAASFGFG